jgi:hypothetical protein
MASDDALVVHRMAGNEIDRSSAPTGISVID